MMTAEEFSVLRIDPWLNEHAPPGVWWNRSLRKSDGGDIIVVEYGATTSDHRYFRDALNFGPRVYCNDDVGQAHYFLDKAMRQLLRAAGLEANASPS